jgi:hypothetical protein
MNSVHIRATFIIKFAYHPIAAGYSNNYPVIGNEQVSPVTENTSVAAGKSCAVCGSRLHMTSKLYKALFKLHRLLISFSY